MARDIDTTDVLVIGAGLAGLAAARNLKQAGCSVLVLDKARGVGGRAATRRIGGATLDHGAQFATTRSDAFSALFRSWCEEGVVVEWCRGFTGQGDGHPRWRGAPSMTALSKKLAQGLRLRLQQQVTTVRLLTDGWQATSASGESHTGEALVLTPPVPQSLALLKAGGVRLDTALTSQLEAIRYECCIAVMALLDGPSRIPGPGARPLDGEPLSWISDNFLKGVSAVPAITLHAGPEYSHSHWDQDRNEVGRELLAAAQDWLGSNVTAVQVHGWGYSKPTVIYPEPCLVVPGQFPLVLAGDAFAGPKIEGAVRSGWAAAAALLDG